MQTKIRPYLRHLLKRNLAYVLILIVLIILTVFSLYMMIKKLIDSQTQIKSLKRDIDILRAKKTLLNAASNLGDIDLTADTKLLNSLIPDIEDYFSIASSLEELSATSGFRIISYNISLQESPDKDKIILNVIGAGDQQSFVNFLSSYNFGGGRLITLDNIEVKSSDQAGSYSLSLNFFHKKTSLKNGKIDYQKTIANLKKLKGKVRFVIKSEEEIPVPAVKSNPF